MATPTPVNSQVTDTLSQSTIMSIGTAGSTAQQILTMGFASAMGAVTESAAAQQDATQTLADAALTAALRRMGQCSETGKGVSDV